MPRTRKPGNRWLRDEELVVLLRAVRRRLLLRSVAGELLRSLLFAGMVVVLCLGIEAAGVAVFDIALLVMAALAAAAYLLLAGLPKIIRNWPTPLRTARITDARLGLKEGLATLAEVQDRDDPVVALLARSVREGIRGRDATAVARLPAGTLMSVALLGTLLFGGAAYLGGAAPVDTGVAGEPGEPPATAGSDLTLDAEALEEYAEQVSRDAQRYGDQELLELAQTLAQLTDEVLAQEITEGQALQQLEQLIDQLDEAFAGREAPSYSPQDVLAGSDVPLPETGEAQANAESQSGEEVPDGDQPADGITADADEVPQPQAGDEGLAQGESLPGPLQESAAPGYLQRSPEAMARLEAERQAMARMRMDVPAGGDMGGSGDGSSIEAGVGTQDLFGDDLAQAFEFGAESEFELPTEEAGSRRIKVDAAPETDITEVSDTALGGGSWQRQREQVISGDIVALRHREAVARFFRPAEDGEKEF